MNGSRQLLPAIALILSACATAPAPAPPVAAAPKLTPEQASLLASQSNAQLDAGDFRKALEEAYGSIVARQNKPVNAPSVDVEAAASMPIPEHRTIKGAVSLFTTDLKPSIQTSLTRSARYKKLIDGALMEAGLPKGLAYLPVIESGYAPTLTSRAGAHGIWQFMPETAREYGLRVDWWVDERADPERSTRAAAKYLKDLYRQFDDWPLTLAAYNAGPGRIRRAMNETGATTFWQLLEQSAVPKETRGYVPTFYATLLIATDPATYGFHLGEAEELDVKRIEVEGPVSIKYLAEVAKVDEEVMKALNPAYRQGVLPPGHAAVRVPTKSAELVASRAATLRNDDAYMAVCSFRLREGDSLGRLARALGTKVETLLAMNDLSSPGRVGEGDAVYLPVRARELGSLLARGHEADAYYAVRKGDTLYSIAKKHDLSVEELRDLNDLSSGMSLKVGMRLRVVQPRALTAGGM
ncbi:MAG: mltD 2 [Acidobacteria bacterium]|nr:mltD 2 [Acidobacteriota bacterium]